MTDSQSKIDALEGERALWIQRNIDIDNIYKKLGGLEKLDELFFRVNPMLPLLMSLHMVQRKIFVSWNSNWKMP